MGAKPKKDIVGKKFGKLTVLDDYISISNGTKWKCMCECGREVYVYRGKLTSGYTKSCGCIVKTLGGLSDHKLYSVWANMKDRCYNSSNHAFHHYGGKGIKVCDEWSNFIVFYNWSMENGYEDGLTIDRINSNSDYSPNNCEWITKSENTARANHNSHKRRTEFKYFGISPNGDKYTFTNASEFAKEHSLNASCVRNVANGKRPHHKNWKFGFTGELND